MIREKDAKIIRQRMFPGPFTLIWRKISLVTSYQEKPVDIPCRIFINFRTV
jgi:hypothetical protein